MTNVTVNQMTSLKSDRPVPNQFSITVGRQVHMQSYRSHIAAYDKDTGILTLGPNWDYSKTTLKYLYRWLQSEIPRAIWYKIQAYRGASYKVKIQAAIDSGYIAYDKSMGGIYS